jgi:polysaccharide biosynthesis transport protein
MWKDVRWAVAVSLLAALAVVAYGLYQTPKYEATAKILVGLRSTLQTENGKPRPIPIPNAPAHGGLYNAALSMVSVIDSPDTAKETIGRLHLEMPPGKLLKNLTAETDPGTMFIKLTYTDTDPTRAQQVANTVGKIARKRARSLDLNAMDGSVIAATLWQPAKSPASPVSPTPFRNGLITLAIGLVLSKVVIVLREYRRDNHQRFL